MVGMTNQIEQTEHGSRIKDVEFIWARNSKEFLFANSVLIHGKKPVMVDPSASFTYISQLAESKYVRTVVNTHYHGDHRSLNHLFRDVYFASHEDDAQAISDFDYYSTIAAQDDRSFYIEWIRQVFKKYKIVDSPVSIKLKDGDILETGSERIRIVSIPGHTPGHIALYFEEADALFCSDIDLTPYGPWYANVVSDIELFKKSVQKIRKFQCRYYVPSHGERIYEREQFLEKLDRFEFAFEARDQKILGLLQEKPMELDELCSHGIVYRKGSLNDPLKCYFQMEMVRKHLELLERDGLVKRVEGVFVI